MAAVKGAEDSSVETNLGLCSEIHFLNDAFGNTSVQSVKEVIETKVWRW